MSTNNDATEKKPQPVRNTDNLQSVAVIKNQPEQYHRHIEDYEMKEPQKRGDET